MRWSFEISNTDRYNFFFIDYSWGPYWAPMGGRYWAPMGGHIGCPRWGVSGAHDGADGAPTGGRIGRPRWGAPTNSGVRATFLVALLMAAISGAHDGAYRAPTMGRPYLLSIILFMPIICFITLSIPSGEPSKNMMLPLPYSAKFLMASVHMLNMINTQVLQLHKKH